MHDRPLRRNRPSFEAERPRRDIMTAMDRINARGGAVDANRAKRQCNVFSSCVCFSQPLRPRASLLDKQVKERALIVDADRPPIDDA